MSVKSKIKPTTILAKREEVVAALKKVADEKLSHLFQLDEETINNVLTLQWALSSPEIQKELIGRFFLELKSKKRDSGES